MCTCMHANLGALLGQAHFLPAPACALRLALALGRAHAGASHPSIHPMGAAGPQQHKVRRDAPSQKTERRLASKHGWSPCSDILLGGTTAKKAEARRLAQVCLFASASARASCYPSGKQKTEAGRLAKVRPSARASARASCYPAASGLERRAASWGRLGAAGRTSPGAAADLTSKT